MHSYDAFHTRSDKPGVEGIIGMHRFNFCLVVVLLWCENTIGLAPFYSVSSESYIKTHWESIPIPLDAAFRNMRAFDPECYVMPPFNPLYSAPRSEGQSEFTHPNFR